MRISPALFAASMAFAALIGSGAALAEQQEAMSARLSATLNEFRARYGLPGVTAAIALPDGEVLAASSGLADVESGRPMTDVTPMLAASIGKTFVAATVLALESQGQLSADDPLADYLGDRPWFDELPNAAAINIDHLLRHQSGLPDHPYLPEFQAAAAAQFAAGEGAFTPEELLGFVTGREALFDPGTAWAYSDTGYILLGLLIEEVTGRAYYEVVQELFISPLGLTGTVPSDRPEIPGLAVGYTIPGNPFGLPERTADSAGRLVWDPGVEWTGGGLASTAGDLVRWGHALFGGLVMDPPYLDRLLDGVAVAPEAPDTFYGAGVAIYTATPRGRVYGHGGWIPAYVSSLRHYADHGVTVAFQINSDAKVVDGSSDLVPALEAALADLALGASP